MMRFPTQVLKDDKAPVIALLAVVIRQFGTECFDWTPEFLKEEIRIEMDVEISELNSDKIQAGITLLSSEAFEDQHEVFETCCHLLNNHPDTFEDFCPLEAEELAAALIHARMILEGQDGRLNFSQEVRAYAGAVFSHYGMCKAPDIMPTALVPEPTDSGCCSADPDKNEALLEIGNARAAEIKEYLSTLLKD